MSQHSRMMMMQWQDSSCAGQRTESLTSKKDVKTVASSYTCSVWNFEKVKPQFLMRFSYQILGYLQCDKDKNIPQICSWPREMMLPSDQPDLREVQCWVFVLNSQLALPNLLNSLIPVPPASLAFQPQSQVSKHHFYNFRVLHLLLKLWDSILGPYKPSY